MEEKNMRKDQNMLTRKKEKPKVKRKRKHVCDSKWAVVPYL